MADATKLRFGDREGHYEKGRWMSTGNTAYRLYAYRLYRLKVRRTTCGFPETVLLGELHDCHEGQISLTSLNCPHERNVQPRQFCQSLLRQFLPQAKLPHTLAEGGHNDSHKCGHKMRV